jgi:membrane-bound ClpP family serine protease
LFQDSGVNESRGFQWDRMQRRRVNIVAAFAVLLVFGCGCFADTFTNQQSGEVLHGYVAGESEQGKTTVYTQEKGKIELNLARWNIVRDRHGRNNKIIVLRLDAEIMLEIETAALESAIGDAVAEGPLFILLEIDTPGGRTDLAGRLCDAIAEARWWPLSKEANMVALYQQVPP